MMPLAKLSTAPVTSSQPPHRMSGRAGAIGARGTTGHGDERDDREQRRRQQPRDLAAVERVEQPADAG